MPLERISPDPTRGDPGNECHKIEAPAPIAADTLLGQLSPEKVIALRALSAGQTVREVLPCQPRHRL